MQGTLTFLPDRLISSHLHTTPQRSDDTLSAIVGATGIWAGGQEAKALSARSLLGSDNAVDRPPADGMREPR